MTNASINPDPGSPGHPEDGYPPARPIGRRLLASSATVSIFNGLGVIAGFVQDAVIAAAFGIGSQTDAFFSAWRLPNLSTVVLGMAAASTLVPLFARDAPPDDDAAQSGLFSRIFNAIVLIMMALSGLGILLSPWLVGGLFGGLPEASLELAASLSRILFLTLLITGPVEVLRAYLYANQVFAVPTAINFVRSTVAVAVLVLGGYLGQRMGLVEAGSSADEWGLKLLAWGFVAGVLAQLIVLVWQVIRHTPLRWRPLVDPRHPRLLHAARLSAAPTAGAVVRQSINLAETVIASYLPPGSVTILSYANRLTFVISSVFLSSITTASMPVLSRSMGAGRRLEVRQTLLSAFRLVVFMAVPLGIGLAALGVPLIRLLFERGRFTVEASQLTGSVLSLYALSILALGYFRVVQAYFYAALRASVVLILFMLLAIVAVGLDLLLVGRLGVQGIAIGFSTGTVLVTIIGLRLLVREQLRSGDAKADSADQASALSLMTPLLRLSAKVALASLLMAATALGMLRVLPDTPWALMPAVLVGLIAFLAAAQGLRVQELSLIWDLLHRRGRRLG